MHRLILLLALLIPASLLAETLTIPVGSQGADIDERNLPRKGESKRSVLERFGLADEEHAPVGQPPITRWDYREFSVYFEYDHVINSVRHHHARHLDTVKEQQ
ncbi:MAG TPA: phosphodiesterase [Pseudomonas sp.]